MLHASTGSGSAAAPVSEPPAPAAAAPAKRTPRPRSARRSISPLRATSGTNGAIPSLLIVMFSSLEVGQPPAHLQVIEFMHQRIMFAVPFHGLFGLFNR